MGKIRYRCCVPGCSSRCLKGVQGPVKFFRCPDPDRLSSPYLQTQAKLRLEAWRNAVAKDLPSNGKICSKHFVSGQPVPLACTNDVDWVPVLQLPNKTHSAAPKGFAETNNVHENPEHCGNMSGEQNSDSDPPNSNRIYTRRQSAANISYDYCNLDASPSCSERTLSCSNIHDNYDSDNLQNADTYRSSSEYTLSCDGDDQLHPEEEMLFYESSEEYGLVRTKKRQTRNKSIQATPLIRSHFTQTDSSGDDNSTKNDKIAQEVERLRKVIELQNMEMNDLKETIRRTKVDLQSLKERPLDIKYYTGLDNYHVVQIIFQSIEPYMIAPLNLTKEQVFLMTLQKLRFDYFYKSLSIAYEVSPATTSKYFLSTIYTLYKTFYNIVHWPSRETLREHTPQCFRDLFGNETTIIIDCFEIRGERSSNPIAAAKQWSDYKKGNTSKYLIGISPAGSVIFISKGYGGRSSDKYITTTCGFLDNVSEGDVIMADRGFLIGEEIKKKNAKLNLPAFKKTGTQLTALEVENTRKIATVRIHVERVIGVLREKYQLLKGHVPMSLLTRQHNGVMAMDMVVYVAAILVNMCKPIIN